MLTRDLVSIRDRDCFSAVGGDDFVQLLPVGGATPLYYKKLTLLLIGESIVRGMFCHLSGPTGSGKTSLLEALEREPENWQALCRALAVPFKSLRIYEIESVDFESPGELRQRRALKGGSTYDEESQLVSAMRDAVAHKRSHYPTIFFKEVGRVHSAMVQNGLLNLMRDGVVRLPNGESIDMNGVAFVADSNYQAESDATHTLVVFDEALKRRFAVNLTLDYIDPEIEAQILRSYVEQGYLENVDDDLIEKVVTLGALIRNHRRDGELKSACPPTMYGYVNMLRLVTSRLEFGAPSVVLHTILGNVSNDDRKLARSLVNDVWGVKVGDEKDPTFGGLL